MSIPELHVLTDSRLSRGRSHLEVVEAALAGGVLILGRDGCLRDLASLHGHPRFERLLGRIDSIESVLEESDTPSPPG